MAYFDSTLNDPRKDSVPGFAPVSSGDAYDRLHIRLAQLEALLMVTHGHGIKSFRHWSERVQDDYLFACYQHVVECRALADKLELAP